MPLFFIVITIILLALVSIYVTRPLFIPQSQEDPASSEDTTLAAESAYQFTLERVRELDFEYGLGKMSQQEYEEQRALLVQEAAEALRELKTIESPPVTIRTDAL